VGKIATIAVGKEAIMNQKTDNLNSLLQNALTYFNLGNFSKAKIQVLKILKYQPKHDLANLLLAKISFQELDDSNALIYLKRVAFSPSFSGLTRSAYQEVLQEIMIRQQFYTAQIASGFLIERNVDDGHAWYLLGSSFQGQKKYADALNSFNKALKLLPNNLGVLTNIGAVLILEDKALEAEKILLQTLTPHSDVMISHNNLGCVYRHMGRIDEAIDQFKLSLKYNPHYAEAHNNLGLAYASKTEYELAIQEYERAIQCQPHLLMAYCNWAKALHNTGRLKEAMNCCETALEIKNDSPEVWTCLADVLRSANHVDQSIECYIKALQYWPEENSQASRMTFTGLLFSLNYHPDLDEQTIFNAYKDYEARFCLSLKSVNPIFNNERNIHKKLKIGYVTQSFYNQACVFFLLPLIEQHDHSQVEIYAYTDLPKEDEMTIAYRNAVDHWNVTKGMSNEDVVKKIQDDGIDILIDVSGHTSENRLLVFAQKPAPVSLHWLEFGYTTGLTAIDYYLCDRATIPLGSEHLFSEKPWYLDGASYAYRPSKNMGEVGELPAYKNGYITLGTLSRAIRLNHKVIRVWAQLLIQIPNARLLIDSSDFKDPLAQNEIKLRFSEYGIESDRLEIGFNSPAWDTLRKVDIGLDCFPHNSGTTLFETLYMGIPFVTLAGRPSVGRLGASILEGLGRKEWIAYTEEEYIEKIVNLSKDVSALNTLRKNLRQEMEASSLMNEPAFARSVEKAYRQMWQIYCEENPS
jgi:protein O-GlcNAc transferase